MKPQILQDIDDLKNGAGLKPATASALGGIIVGDNLTIGPNGRLSAGAPYVHPSEHPASMIKGLHQCATNGDASSVNGRTFVWSGQQGQPQWLWAANEPGTQSHVWNRESLSVGSAYRATNSADYSAVLRNTTVSTAGPTGGSNGEVWIQFV